MEDDLIDVPPQSWSAFEVPSQGSVSTASIDDKVTYYLPVNSCWTGVHILSELVGL